ncbi:hypothetical protein BCF59_0130 [Mycoplasmopsis mustelae]|uniref:Lipoprotein n=1 Tax=Mycoplasmopsis mustelae TaxID=171289 RepID=A0A4R7UE25_9BACT|nr:hypothetical protein [Mycoplasmopsis mustelae]TDV24181.1 hypothetical protein BCF59_0130 [Mycoplasmopsis mustelae]
MKTKKKLWFFISSTLSLATATSVAAACGNQQTNTNKNVKTNDEVVKLVSKAQVTTKVDLAANGINLKNSVGTRTFLYPAATAENYMHSDGSFTFGLHEKPLTNATGEWTAFAIKVKEQNDNTPVEPLSIKKATATADTTKDPLKHEPRLFFTFDATHNNALDVDSFYTFEFYKNDGSERIVYSNENIQNKKNIFSTKILNDQTIDPTKYGVQANTAAVQKIEFLHPAARDENYLAKSDGSFTFGLHAQPLVGVTGEWVAIATEVRGLDDNTLKPNGQIVKAEATADETQDPTKSGEYRLFFTFDATNKNALNKDSFYTFTFFKKDGSQKIVYSEANIKGSKNTFSTKPIDKAQKVKPTPKTVQPTNTPKTTNQPTTTTQPSTPAA